MNEILFEKHSLTRGWVLRTTVVCFLLSISATPEDGLSDTETESDDSGSPLLTFTTDGVLTASGRRILITPRSEEHNAWKAKTNLSEADYAEMDFVLPEKSRYDLAPSIFNNKGEIRRTRRN